MKKLLIFVLLMASAISYGARDASMDLEAEREGEDMASIGECHRISDNVADLKPLAADVQKAALQTGDATVN